MILSHTIFLKPLQIISHTHLSYVIFFTIFSHFSSHHPSHTTLAHNFLHIIYPTSFFILLFFNFIPHTIFHPIIFLNHFIFYYILFIIHNPITISFSHTPSFAYYFTPHITFLYSPYHLLYINLVIHNFMFFSILHYLF